jgi:transposase
VFVLKSGIPWEMLPKEMGCGSGMTCWRRLREWQEAGVWERLVFEELLDTVEPIKRPGRGRPKRRPEKLCTPTQSLRRQKVQGSLEKA